jgi:hypothetical protein
VEGKLGEAVVLSELLLEQLEMNTAPLSFITMKASRLARLVGQFDMQQIFVYETSGYPRENKQLTVEAWRLAKKAGRTYTIMEEDVPREYARVDIIEQLEINAADAKSLPRSASIVQQMKNEKAVKEAIEALAKRRAYVYDFVSSVYFELKFSAVASDVFERTRSQVDRKILVLIPDAVKRFTAVYENLLSSSEEDWSNAVHGCRRILEAAADALYPSREDKIGGNNKSIKLGKSNYVNRLMAYVEEHSTSTRFTEIVGSHLKYLGERLQAIFEAANKGTHNVISSRAEADRYVIYTYLFIGDILQLQSELDVSQKSSIE